jgi:hypothetical protein
VVGIFFDDVPALLFGMEAAHAKLVGDGSVALIVRRITGVDRDLAECLAIYQAEKAGGTEMPAIIGRLSDYIGAQWQRLRDEKRAEDARRSEETRLERERRLLSYADCPWTQIKGSKFVYCRKNGRVFQLKPNSDKSLSLYRVQAVDDAASGELIGRYRSRGDASKVVAKAAYEPEPWR